MNRKKKLALLLAAICIVVIFIYLSSLSDAPSGETETTEASPTEPSGLNDGATSASSSGETESTESDVPERLFVVPENPLGTIGAFSALALATGTFALRKRKQ
jgi:hypothetical protein